VEIIGIFFRNAEKTAIQEMLPIWQFI